MSHPPDTITQFTDDELPAIADLPGDLRQMAEIMAPIRSAAS